MTYSKPIVKPLKLCYNSNMDFAEKIKKIRQTLLMSQRDFANDIGISHITVAIWETGKVKPSLKYQRIIKEYCEKKNVHID